MIVLKKQALLAPSLFTWTQRLLGIHFRGAIPKQQHFLSTFIHLQLEEAPLQLLLVPQLQPLPRHRPRHLPRQLLRRLHLRLQRRHQTHQLALLLEVWSEE